jgi:hypothetical protein
VYLSSECIELLISISSFTPITGSYDAHHVASACKANREYLTAHLAEQVIPLLPCAAVPDVPGGSAMRVQPSPARIFKTHVVLLYVFLVLVGIPYRVHTNCQYTHTEVWLSDHAKVHEFLLPAQEAGGGVAPGGFRENLLHSV